MFCLQGGDVIFHRKVEVSLGNEDSFGSHSLFHLIAIAAFKRTVTIATNRIDNTTAVISTFGISRSDESSMPQYLA